MSYPTADNIIHELVRERDRLLKALIAMVNSYQHEGSMKNESLLNAKDALEKSGINFDENGDIIEY